MKPGSLKNAREEQTKPDDTKSKLARFLQQFNTLDMTGYGMWPIAVKISCYVFCFLLVCLISYFVVIQPQLLAIETAASQQQQLLNGYKEKSSKLRNLKQYQASLLQMEKKFNQQLEQLPKESEIPSLLEDIHRAGQESGLKIVNIQLENEQKQAFFIEQPITIEARGDYHAYGKFVSYLAELPRIVTLHDFVMKSETNPIEQSDVPVVAFSLKVKTYRYISRGEQNKSAASSSIPSSAPAQNTTAPAAVSTPTVNDSNTAPQQEAPSNTERGGSGNEHVVAFGPKPIARSRPLNWIYSSIQPQWVTDGA